jgi:hypothetical protein
MRMQTGAPRAHTSQASHTFTYVQTVHRGAGTVEAAHLGAVTAEAADTRPYIINTCLVETVQHVGRVLNRQAIGQ